MEWLKKIFRRLRPGDGPERTPPPIIVIGSDGVQIGPHSQMTNNHVTNSFLFIVQRAVRSARGKASGVGEPRPSGKAEGPDAGGPEVADIDMSVVLWGAPGSGKSTYLAALSRAAAAANWTLTPRGPDATAALTQMKDRFLGRRNFPDATPLKVRSYAFVLWGELGISSVTPILSRTKRARVRINLSIVDPAGQLYESDRFGQFLEDELAELADSLASAQGIIFFFDPTGESEDGAAFRHFHAMATHLMSENMERSGREHYGRRLPHRLAVCVSKFDHPDVFSVAEAAGYSDAKGGGLPVVPEGRAEEFFNLMCGRDWRHGAREESSIDMGLRGEIQNCFDRDNVRYFATSSIGFHLGPSGEFSREDFVNIKGSGISREVRGSINPINVLEPLIWLGAQEVRAAASASASYS